jgi:EF hand domain-containing protein
VSPRPLIQSSFVLVTAASAGVVSGLVLVAMTSWGSAAMRRSTTSEPVTVSAAARAIDADRDGVISSGEIANAPISLKTLDRDGDGRLTADELDPTQRAGDLIVTALDADRDGQLSASEIGRAVSLSALDRNHDGRLTADETRVQSPERGKRSRPDRRHTTWARI